MMIDRRLAALALAAPGWVYLTVSLALLASATAVGQGFLTGQVIARIMTRQEFDAIVALAIGVAVLIGTRAVLLWLRDLAATVAGGKVKREIRSRLYRRLMELGPGYTVRVRTGEALATLGDGVEALDPYVSRYLPQALVAVVVPLAVVAYIAWLDIFVGIVVLSGALAVAFFPNLWKKALGERGRRHWNTHMVLTSRFIDGVQGMTDLKAMNASRRYGHALGQETAQLYFATRSMMGASLGHIGVTNLTHALGVALAAIVGTIRLLSGDLSLTELLVVLFLANESFRPLLDLGNYWHQGYRGISASAGLLAILDASPVTPSAASPRTISLSGKAPDIRFEQVSFVYPGAASPALRDVNLAVSPGESIAIVGRSGSGKTTLMSLLLRFFDPTGGRIAIDGMDLRELDLQAYRRAIALVSQDVFLFHGTVADNLRLARPNATNHELMEAARLANAADFIGRLPQQYETVIGERGDTLSGGERQRLAIARAFLKNAPILVLDEPTSSLDGESERGVKEALERLAGSRTTFTIAHRLSTVANADRVVVLEGGRVVEIGAPGVLERGDGVYARLVSAQREAV